MTAKVTQKPTVVLSKGLVTEAGELSFPEGASVDELNMSLERTGSRRRRLGLGYETNNALNNLGHKEGDVVSTHVWENAGGVAGLTFLVVQHRNILHFYLETDTAISASKKPFTLDISSFNRPSGFGASTVEIDTTVLQGILIVSSSEINTFKIEYNDISDAITAERIDFKVRDFKYAGDTSKYYSDIPKASITSARLYDTKNSGWRDVGDSLHQNGGYALNKIVGDRGVYPSLNKQWFLGRNTKNAFDPFTDESSPGQGLGWSTAPSTGTSLIGNGSFILDLYRGNREEVSGVAGLDEIETSRFKTVATFAGRVFYAGMSNHNTDKVYFSQLIYQDEKLGDCFQKNDPTSELTSDLLDTDGGAIKISGAYNIQKLQVLGPFLLVFAENGVWFIKGVDDVFRATEYSIDKISEIGIANRGSFVSAEGRPYWWSDSGIHTVTGTESGGLTEANISISTIQTFWSNIDPMKRNQAKGTYDSLNQRIYWFYPSNDETTQYKYNRVLIFDEKLKAFYPWSIGDAVSSQYVVSPFFLKGSITKSVEFNVIDSAGNTVTDSLGNPIIVTDQTREYEDSAIYCLTRDSLGNISVAEFNDTMFKDWGTVNYTSYMETPYDFTGDLSTRKTPLYLTTFFKITEEGYTGSEATGYEFIRPSGCLVSSFWDFSTKPTSSIQQAYRLKHLPVPSGPAFNYPSTVTTSRLRLRGRGRSFRLRFESEEGKDFHLLGFDVVIGLTGK